MIQLGERLALTVRSMVPRLREFSETQAAQERAAGIWTRKELLGHLIDSASNNHQRFVRLQLADDLRLPLYEQEGWVRVQNYQATEWESLIELWQAYNLHLARLISHAKPASLSHTCQIGDGETVTLQFLMEDYLTHMDHHLAEVFSTL